MDTKTLHEFNMKMSAAQETAIYLVGKLSQCKNPYDQKCIIEESERYLNVHGYLILSALLHIASYPFAKKGPKEQNSIRKSCAVLNRALTEKLYNVTSG